MINVHSGESVIDERSTMESHCLWVQHLILLNAPITLHDHFCILILLRTEQSSSISFHSQANIIFGFDLPKLTFSKFEWTHKPQKENSIWQTCHIFLTSLTTQCRSLHNCEAQVWPRIGPQPLDSLSSIFDSVIKLSSKGIMLRKYEKERGTEVKENEETDKEY